MTTPALEPLKGLRVLIVEDHPDAGQSLQLMLSLMGCDTRLAAAAPQAVHHCRHFRPHVVLLDLGLPGMNGWDLAWKLRNDEGYVATLIAISGFGTATDRERSRQAGIDLHLVKPVKPAVLHGLLENVAQRQSGTRVDKPTERFEKNSAVDRMIASVQRQVGSLVRDLHLVVTREGIRLRGKAASHYAKQLAQEAFFERAPQPILANEIEVA